MEESKPKLRKATTEENELLRSWADKNCRSTRKAILIMSAGFLCAYIFLLIVNAIYIHSVFLVAVVIFLCVYQVAFSVVLYFYISPRILKKIGSGEYKVQSGSITDLNETGNKPDNKDYTVLFEAEDGNRSYITVRKEHYKNINLGPCLIVKCDEPKENKYFKVFMSDQLK